MADPTLTYNGIYAVKFIAVAVCSTESDYFILRDDAQDWCATVPSSRALQMRSDADGSCLRLGHIARLRV